jgi:thiamine pyrophosphate-dependent acetolactate synthase large subunit-like protein
VREAFRIARAERPGAVHLELPEDIANNILAIVMKSQKLETAIRLKQHLIILVLRDEAYGMIKWKQAHMQFDEFGLDYSNPDFVKYAQACLTLKTSEKKRT